MRKILFTIIIIFIIFTCACDFGSKKDANSIQDAKVIASVNNKKISVDDYNKKLKTQKNLNPTDYNSLQAKKELLEEMIDFELLFQEAMREGFDEDIQIKQTMIKTFLKEKTKEITMPSDEDLNTYYQNNIDNYKEVRASHILCRVDPAKFMNKEKAEQAELVKKLDLEKKMKCEKLLKRITKGEDFASLAKENSEDSSASRGGDLGYFNKSRMVKPFADAAFLLEKAGDVSPLVQTSFGYHIILLTDKRVQSFDMVKKQIAGDLGRRIKDKFLNDYVEDLYKNADVKIYKEKLSNIK
ncbi:MAG: peptidylprolyl isomerase [Pseudomonadota bacterium]